MVRLSTARKSYSNLSEELEGRLMDAIVYLTLMYGMINQEKPNSEKQSYYSNHT